MIMIDDNIFRLVAMQRVKDGSSIEVVLGELIEAANWAANEYELTIMQDEQPQ